MGGDGYWNLKKLSKENNGYTFVQDSSMSTVSQVPELTRIKNEKSFLF